jgi:hypothetical protein
MAGKREGLAGVYIRTHILQSSQAIQNDCLDEFGFPDRTYTVDSFSPWEKAGMRGQKGKKSLIHNPSP